MNYTVDFYKCPSNTPSNYNVISTCIFLMKASYKSTQLYYNGLKNLTRIIENSPKEDKLYLYLFHDKTIEEKQHKDPQINKEIQELWIPLLNDLRNKERIFLIRYDFPEFKEDKFYHVSTFGTIVRFLPFFDLPENINIDIVYCIDLDLNKTVYKQIINLISYMRKHKDIDMYFRTRECYEVNFWTYIQKLKNVTHLRIIASSFATRIKFAFSYFTSFLRDILKNKNTELHELLNTIKDIDPIKGNNYKFAYGYDEYFINKYILYDAVINKLNILLLIQYNLSSTINDIFKRLSRETKNGTVLTTTQKRLLKEFIPTYNFNIGLSDNIFNINFNSRDNVQYTISFLWKLKSKNENRNLFITDLEYECLSRSQRLYKKYGKQKMFFALIKYDNKNQISIHRTHLNLND